MHSVIPAVLTLVLATAWTTGAVAATFTVNSTADGTDGACTGAAGGCTIHDAIQQAVVTAGRDTIAFDPMVFPIGAPATILLFQSLPLIADPAGTVLDGAGAGVIIEAGNAIASPPDPIVFASAAGVPLAKVTVANVTVHGFSGTGILVCGGQYPLCAADVSSVVVRNVVASGNGGNGVRVQGRDVAKVEIVDSVVRENQGTGVHCKASGSITGTKITRVTARDNDGSGIIVEGTLAATGTVMSDCTAVLNGFHGLGVGAQRTTKTKLVNATVSRNQNTGISIFALDAISSSSFTNVATSGNAGTGLELLSFGGIAGAVLKGVVADDNDDGIDVDASSQVVGLAITDSKAAGNQYGGMILTSGGAGVVGAKIRRVFLVGNLEFGMRLNGSGNAVQQVRASGNDGDAAIDIQSPGGGNTIEKCSAAANNTFFTIVVRNGSTGNVIEKNVSRGNDGDDLTDQNAGCDANTWKENVFAFANAACIQ